MDEATFYVLKAYERIFDSPDGELVLEDLRRVYSLRLNDDANDELSEIPHPYRAYFLEGGRDVLQRIEATVALSRDVEAYDGRRDAE